MHMPTQSDLPGSAEHSGQMHASETSLKDALSTVLPDGFKCRIRYVHSPPKRCEPLFSPVPGQGSEKTRLSSHFLTASVPLSSLNDDGAERDVLVYAVEVLIYSTASLTTMFVSKADSTGYLPPTKPSPIKTISTTFLSWLSSKERRKSPSRKLVISLFGRAQSQYLFPGSAENAKKHVLDDRQLIKWWIRVLDPVLGEARHIQGHTENFSQCRGFITVPGYSGPELRLFLPPGNGNWESGNPLPELARTRGVPEHAPTRCLLPRFPDDPKARFMQDLDDEVGLMEDACSIAATTSSPSKRKNGRWKTLHGLERFWEAMEFRQECSSGRVVGFLWVVIGHIRNTSTPLELDRELSNKSLASMVSEQNSQESQSSVKSVSQRPRRKKLSGPIVPRQPRLKGGSSNLSANSEPGTTLEGDSVRLTKDGYDQVMQTLLHLDFANAQVAALSTAKWVAEVSSICGLPKNTWSLDIIGTAKVENNTSNGVNGTAQVNDLGGMIKKRKKMAEEGRVDEMKKATDTQPLPDTQGVNMLGAALVRKKVKASGA